MLIEIDINGIKFLKVEKKFEITFILAPIVIKPLIYKGFCLF